MQIKSLKIRPIASIVLLIMITFFFQPSLAGAAPIVNTDKDVYNNGETIKVNFSNSPGNSGDWICIAPEGAPDTEAGDYKYMPKGLTQGFLTFDPPSAPGKYEARAYYNYSRNGYVVSGRYVFTAVTSPEIEAAIAKRMERTIDPNNPAETNLAYGKGLVYIFRETSFGSAGYNVSIAADGKSIVDIGESSYFAYPVLAGVIQFRTLGIRGTQESNVREPYENGKVTIKIKPGYVYYLKLGMRAVPGWGLDLAHVPHQEGASIISSSKLTQIKR
jgi:hypothetical protein